MRVECRDGIGRIRPVASPSRPSSLVETLQGLRQALDGLLGAPDLAVLVLAGMADRLTPDAAAAHCAVVADLPPAARLEAQQALVSQWLNPLVLRLRADHRPVIGTLAGECGGFGLALALACDLLVVTDDAVLDFRAVARGLVPVGGIAGQLARRLGRGRTLQTLWQGERLGARQALELGLVSRVVAADSIDAEVMALARRLADGPPQALAEVKRLVHGAAEVELAAQLQAEAEAFGRCSAAPEFVAGAARARPDGSS